MSWFESVHRSVAEWVFAAAAYTEEELAADPPPTQWTVKDERSEVSDEQRPVVIVEPTGEKSTPFARSSYTQGDVQHADTWTVTCYPEATGTPAECTRRARMLAERLEDALVHGLLTPAVAGPPAVAEEQFGGPLVLPLWDFAGLGLEDDRPGAQSGTISVESYTVRPIPDPLDDRRWTVVLEMRLTWWVSGRSRRDSEEPETVATVPGTYEPL